MYSNHNTVEMDKQCFILSVGCKKFVLYDLNGKMKFHKNTGGWSMALSLMNFLIKLKCISSQGAYYLPFLINTIEDIPPFN